MMAYYAQLVEHGPDGMVIHDGHRIIDVNAATLRLAGATAREQVVGQLVSSLFERPFLKAVTNALCESPAAANHAVFVRERLHGVDGAVRMVEVSAQLFLEQGRPTAHLVLHDVQDRLIAERLVEEQFEQSRRMERAAEARIVAGGIAHQLNNKLQIILGFSGELVESPLGDDQRADITEINRAANECARITRQLLQIASDAPFKERRVLLDTTILSIMHELERGFAPSAAGVRCRTELVPAVRLDPGQLRQMLENLLQNARHAMEGRGPVDVMVRAATLGAPQLACDGRRMPTGQYATVAVRDTGRGISHATQRHILEPFFTTDRVGQAAGLGLSAVQGMVRQNGGYLTFSSVVGRGSEFTLWFPEAGRETDTGTAGSDVVTATSTATIVVIDGQAASRIGMSRALERVGYRVLATRSAEETMEVLSRVGSPALVVMGSDIPARYPRLRRSLEAQWPLLRVLALAPEAGSAAMIPPPSAPAHDTWFTLPAPWSEYALVTRVQELLRERDGASLGL